MNPRKHRVLRPSLDRLDQRRLLSTFTPTGLSPAQVAGAYGLNAIAFNANGATVPGNGAGQTIAIVEAYHDPNLSADLHTFDAQYGLPDPQLSQYDRSGGATNDGWAREEALDVEWAHAIAPGASIDVVEARSESLPDLLAAVNAARSLPGVSVVSMSWGGPESPGETANDSTFATPAGHDGITFVAASGDAGAISGPQWPASSPNVLAVGGTTLLLNSSGNYVEETAWAGTSGGTSLYEVEPSYQSSVQSTGRRTTPDVSFEADPSSGVSVYATDPSSGQGGWGEVGGTSLGSPAWSAIVAIVDQGLATVGKASLDGASQTLPALYHLPSSDFHGVASQSLGVSNPYGLGFGPGTSYGFAPAGVVPNLGTPGGSSLVHDLVSGTSGMSGAQAGNGQTGKVVLPPSDPAMSGSVPGTKSGGGSKKSHVTKGNGPTTKHRKTVSNARGRSSS